MGRISFIKKGGGRGGRALLTQYITQQISPLSHLHLYSAFSHWRIPSGSATQCELKRNEHNGTTSRPGIVTCEVCFSQATSRVFRVTAGSPWSPPKDLAWQQSYRRSERYVYLIWTTSSTQKIPAKLRAGAAVRGATRTHSFAGTSLLQMFESFKRLRECRNARARFCKKDHSTYTEVSLHKSTLHQTQTER